MKHRKDIYLVGYTGSGKWNGEGQCVYGRDGYEEIKNPDGSFRRVTRASFTDPMTLEEAKKKVKELVSRSPKAIYKLVKVKRYRY
jgi:hypothetical protein